MKNFADRLTEKIESTGNPVVMGFDPLIDYVPESIKNKYFKGKYSSPEAASLAITEFNIRLLDCIKGIIPAVKPQLAYYEMLGEHGIKCFSTTIKYARENGFIVITDGKRNDILSTASCYAKAYLGRTSFTDGNSESVFDSDALTVNPYLGADGISPFIKECEENGKGIFVLVRTSNPSAVDFQDIKTDDGKYLYEKVADKVSIWGEGTVGESGYSSVGAVVGATWPDQAKSLRKLMPSQIILVPGYGAQGGGAKDAVSSFDINKKGAIVNASRSLMCAYKNDGYDHEDFEIATSDEAKKMKSDLNNALISK